jgi:hypothetical protein
VCEALGGSETHGPIGGGRKEGGPGFVESETFWRFHEGRGAGKTGPPGGSLVSCGFLVEKRMDSSLSDV